MGSNVSGVPANKQIQQGQRIPLPLGHKPRRRKARNDDKRAAVEQSWTDEPLINDEMDCS